MANNYRQTSFIIPDLSQPEEAWLRSEYERRETAWTSDSGDTDDYPIADRFEFAGDAADAADTTWRRHLWIVGDETVNIEAVASLLQAFLAKFRPRRALGFQYSDTCSKMRVDEFSGGAVFITAKSVRFFHADSWLDKQFAAHKKRSKSKSSNTGR